MPSPALFPDVNVSGCLHVTDSKSLNEFGRRPVNLLLTTHSLLVCVIAKY